MPRVVIPSKTRDLELKAPYPNAPAEYITIHAPVSGKDFLVCWDPDKLLPDKSHKAFTTVLDSLRIHLHSSADCWPS